MSTAARADSPDRVSTWEHVQDNSFDQADSKPVSSAAEVSAAEGIAENVPKTSVSSVSVAAGSSDASRPTDDVSRPTDDDIIAQENWIRAQEAEKIEYVGDLEPLTALEEEYKSGNDVFIQKIKFLQKQYSGIRRARGDGNCFFRSFIFAYLEQLILRKDLGERDRLLVLIKNFRKKLVDCGFQELVFEDGMELFLDTIGSVGAKTPLTVQGLESSMRENTISNTLVMFLRFLVSCEIQTREDFYAPFVLGMSDEAPTVEHFCRRYVEPMGEESDHVHIVALTDALRVPIRVVYLDRSVALGLGDDSSSASVNHHDFKPEDMHNTEPLVHVLYRPGHYDILYSGDTQLFG